MNERRLMGIPRQAYGRTLHAVSEERRCASQQKLRANVADGSFTSVWRCPRYVRSSPNSGGKADIPDWQLRASKRHMQRSKSELIDRPRREAGGSRVTVRLWNFVGACYSALILAARITLRHFSVSSAMSFPKSASRVFVLGSASAALTSLLSVSTISLGVLLGAPTPENALASKPGTVSPTSGMSGNGSKRVMEVTPSAPLARFDVFSRTSHGVQKHLH